MNLTTGESTMIPEYFALGGDLPIQRLGFGAMRLTGQPGNWGPYTDIESGVQLLQRSVELGVNFIDTADAYGPGHSEELIAKALHPYPDTLVIATKGGSVKTGPGQVYADGRPVYLRRAVESSLSRLKLERIGLYQLHRTDPQVPLIESVGALAELVAEGKIHHIGLSNVTLTQLQQVQQLTPIASVQNRYNLIDRASEDVLEYCQQAGIAFIPYGPLAAVPYASDAPLATAGGAVARIASELGATQSQIALAWLLTRSNNTVPIAGTTSITHLEENIASKSIRLSAMQMEALNHFGAV